MLFEIDHRQRQMEFSLTRMLINRLFKEAAYVLGGIPLQMNLRGYWYRGTFCLQCKMLKMSNVNDGMPYWSSCWVFLLALWCWSSYSFSLISSLSSQLFHWHRVEYLFCFVRRSPILDYLSPVLQLFNILLFLTTKQAFVHKHCTFIVSSSLVITSQLSLSWKKHFLPSLLSSKITFL